MNIKSLISIGMVFICTQLYANHMIIPPETDHEQPAIQPSHAAPTSSEQNKLEGEAFLKANKTKPGVVTLANGLEYKIIKAGKGPKPTEDDLIKVEYTGRFIDGTEFDSSAKHGGPSIFSLWQVIPGWAEALKLMPQGSIWELYIPPHLAYGNEDAPVTIGPNKTLIFTVNLIDLKKESEQTH